MNASRPLTLAAVADKTAYMPTDASRSAAPVNSPSISALER